MYLIESLLHRGDHLGEAVDLALQERHHAGGAVQVGLNLERKQACQSRIFLIKLRIMYQGLEM